MTVGCSKEKSATTEIASKMTGVHQSAKKMKFFCHTVVMVNYKSRKYVIKAREIQIHCPINAGQIAGIHTVVTA